MFMDTNQNVALITGCSTGIGFDAVKQFAKEGWLTIATVRSVQAMKSLGELKDKNVVVMEMDVTDEVQIIKVVDKVIKTYGKIDLLINNAGYGILGPVEDITLGEAQAQFDVNVWGGLRVMKAVLPHMRERKKGKIITISSIVGLIPFPLYGVYAASKFAIEAISESLRVETEYFGISVSIVEPGTFFTAFWRNRHLPEAIKNRTSSYIALHESFFKKLNNAEYKLKKSRYGSLQHPAKVARLLYQIALTEHPRLRYRIGVDAHIYYWTRKLLPDFVWFRILRWVYKW